MNNINAKTTINPAQGREYSQISLAERLGMSLTFVGYTRWDGYPVYTFRDRYTYGFEDTYIVCCPGTTELYDRGIFGEVEWTYDQITEFMKNEEK